MATKEKPLNAARGRGKGVALGKWAKIDKAQRNMFIAVCLASIVLGVTVVGIVYFVKVIAFNAKMIGEKDQVIADYKSIQDDLKTISDTVNNDLSTNENLEVVARTRSSDCLKNGLTDEEKSSIEEIELLRTCSALRLIPDALPAQLNEEATLASLNQLLLWSTNGLQIDVISGTDVSDTVLEVDEDGEVSESNMKAIGATISINDTTSKIYRALDEIERSIRNYDVASATISWSKASVDEETGETKPETIELQATYRSYYSPAVSIEKKTKKVCADNKSDKCTGKNSNKGKK